MNQRDERQERFARFREEFTEHHVPASHAARWGEIAYSLWHKKYYPVLILSPFAVPPNIRKPWFDKYKRVRVELLTCYRGVWFEANVLRTTGGIALSLEYSLAHSVTSFLR
jgi:hypothetical protein